MHAGGLPVQRLILPVTSQLAIRPNIMQNQAITQIRPAVPGMTTATQLPVGGTALNLQGLQGFALLPAQYVAQVGSISKACKCSLCCPISMSLRWVQSPGLARVRSVARSVCRSGGFNLQGLQEFALLPAQYVAQVGSISRACKGSLCCPISMSLRWVQSPRLARVRSAARSVCRSGGFNLQGLQGFALLPDQYVAQVGSISKACKGSLCCPLSMSLRWVQSPRLASVRSAARSVCRSGGFNLQGLQGFALLPDQYVAQVGSISKACKGSLCCPLSMSLRWVQSPRLARVRSATRSVCRSGGFNLQGLQGFALLPAQYVAQVGSISRACKGSLCCPLSMSLRCVRVQLHHVDRL